MAASAGPAANGAAAQRHGTVEDGKPAPGNPTDYMILLARSWWTNRWPAGRGLARCRPQSASARRLPPLYHPDGRLASTYTRNHQLRQMVGQQALWTQLEAFTRQIHGSLNPMEVATRWPTRAAAWSSATGSAWLCAAARKPASRRSAAPMWSRNARTSFASWHPVRQGDQMGREADLQGAEGRQPAARCHPCLDAYLAEKQQQAARVLPSRTSAKAKARSRRDRQ